MNEELDNLLEQCRQGNADAMARLFKVLDHDLRLMAHRYLRGERPDSSLRSTALLQEVFIWFLKKLQTQEVEWSSRDHFLGSLAWQMQNTVLNHVRRRRAQKRGRDAVRVQLEPGNLADDATESYLALHWALSKLRDHHQRAYEVFMFLEYMGQTPEETAALLRISRATVFRDRTFAAAYLKAQIGGSSSVAAGAS